MNSVVNSFKIFENSEFGKVRVLVDKNNNIWFVAKDISEKLGYTKLDAMYRRLSDKHKINITSKTLENTGFPQIKWNELESNLNVNILTIINESGLYKAVLGSTLEEAEKFQDWIVDDVLPSIRKTFTLLENIKYKGNIDNLVYSKNGIPITTSKIISDYIGKQHKHILRDIDEEINKLKEISPNLDTSKIINDFTKTEYLDSYGRSQVNYELGEMATMQLLLKYSTEHRAKFILMFMEMKNCLNNMFKARLIEAVLPQDNRNRQYVYIIKNPLNETIKIGVAQDVDKRLKQLQTGAGIELELIYRSLICSNAFSIEKEVHSKFEEFRTFGEWFKIKPNVVIEFLESQTFVLKSEFLKYISL